MRTPFCVRQAEQSHELKVKVRVVSGNLWDYHKYLNRRKAPNWNEAKDELRLYRLRLFNELARTPKFRPSPREIRLENILTFGLAKQLRWINNEPDNRPVREGFLKVLRHNLKDQSKKA